MAYLGLTKFWIGEHGRVLREAAESLRLGLDLAAMDGPFLAKQYIDAFRSISRAGVQAVLVQNLPEHQVNRRIVIELAGEYRLPVMYPELQFVEAGGLMSYATTRDDPAVLAGYVHRVLQGSKPGDLPIEEPTEFKFAINLKTAKALGLSIPPILRLQADQLIE